MFGEPTPNGTMRTPFAFAAVAAAVGVRQLRGVGLAIGDQHERLGEAGATGRERRVGGAMPAPCGLPVEDAGRPLTAATRAL